MSETFPTGRYTSIAVSATVPASYTDGKDGVRDPLQAAGSAHVRLDGASLAIFEVTAVNGLTGTVEIITSDGGTWRQWDSYQRAAGASAVLRTAGTTITFVAGDIITVPTLGPFLAVRIKRAAGTSATFAVRTGAGDSGDSGVIPGTGASNLGKAEDAAHTSGDVGVMALSKRTLSPASSAGADGDYATLNTSQEGNLFTGPGYVAGAVPATIAVSNTTLRVLGATNWTGTAATTNNGAPRFIEVCNNSTAHVIYLQRTTTTGSNPAITITAAGTYQFKVLAGETVSVFVPAGYDLLVLSDTAGTDTATAEEFLV